MQITRLSLALAVVVAAFDLAAPLAAAAPPSCSTKAPGKLSLQSSFGLEDGRVRLDQGNGALQTIRYEYKVDGCAVNAGQSSATVLGASKGGHIVARMIGKGASEVTLVVDFSKNNLDAGSYELSAISGDPGLPISQPINVDVKAGGALPWLLGILSLLIGFAVLALRHAASSDKSWAGGFVDFFHPKTFAGPFITGVAGAWTAVLAAYVNSNVWFATGAQIALLLGTATGAVVAAGTVGGIVQEGIKK